MSSRQGCDPAVGRSALRANCYDLPVLRRRKKLKTPSPNPVSKAVPGSGIAEMVKESAFPTVPHVQVEEGARPKDATLPGIVNVPDIGEPDT